MVAGSFSSFFLFRNESDLIYSIRHSNREDSLIVYRKREKKKTLGDLFLNRITAIRLDHR